MTNTLYHDDLPDGLDLGNQVAIDTETLGLGPDERQIMCCPIIIWRWQCPSCANQSEPS